MGRNAIFLVDESVDVEAIQLKISEYTQVKIISFDYYSHKSLTQAKIAHEKVEDYLNQNDRFDIDSKVMSFSTEWYKHPELQNYLEYKNSNLGSLIELEFPRYFINILRKFVGTIRIIEKEKPTTIITSLMLTSVINSISSNRIEVISLEKPKKSTPELVFDTINVRFNLGKKYISFHISRKNFLKLKKFAEKLTKIFFNVKTDLNSSLNDVVLLLDFNPLIYGELLFELARFHDKIILLNQRRPAIVNMNSLRIVKKSNSKILLMDDLIDTSTQQKMEENRNALRIKLDNMFKRQDIFDKIFSVSDYSLWNVIKDSFTNICYNRFSECIEKIELTEILFKKIKIKSILEWTHTSVEEKVIISEAKKYNIPVVTLQHGIMTLNSIFDKYVKIMPYSPSDGTKMAVWGDIMKDYNISHGISETQLLVSGSPRHDVFFKRRNSTKPKDLILIAANSFIEINCNGYDTNSYVKFEEIIKTICLTSQIKEKLLVVKMHPAPSYFNFKSIIETTNPSIPIYYDKNLLELLERSAVVISLNYSTILLDAMILGIPTITIIVEDQNYEEEFPIKNGATICVKEPRDYERVLNDVLYNKEIRNELISKGHQFVNASLSNQGNASKYLANALSNYEN